MFPLCIADRVRTHAKWPKRTINVGEMLGSAISLGPCPTPFLGRKPSLVPFGGNPPSKPETMIYPPQFCRHQSAYAGYEGVRRVQCHAGQFSCFAANARYGRFSKHLGSPLAMPLAPARQVFDVTSFIDLGTTAVTINVVSLAVAHKVNCCVGHHRCTCHQLDERIGAQ